LSATCSTSPHQRTEFADVDINKIITDTLALLEHQFKIAKIQVQSELTKGISAIQGNPGRLQQSS